MKHGLKSKKKKHRKRRSLLAYGLLVIAGLGALGWGGYSMLTSVRPSAQPDPPPQSQEPTPPAETASVQDQEGPREAKARQPIFDRNMNPLAVSFKQVSVYIRPAELQDDQQTVPRLCELLGVAEEKLQAEIRSGGRYIRVTRNVSGEAARKIAAAHYSGVYLVDELQRYYPFHAHAAHTVGFLKDDQGLAGAEFTYDALLKGDRTLASQYLNLSGINPQEIPATGAGVVLTMDIDLQIALDKKIAHLLEQTSAKSASAVLIDASNGEVLAMATLPGYNPNLYWLATASAYQNNVLGRQIPIGGLNPFFLAAAELAAGNVPSAVADREEESDVVITPRVMKVAKGDVAPPAGVESQVWHPGIHISPPFEWPLEFTQHQEALGNFCNLIGLGPKGNALAETQLALEPGVQVEKEKGEPCRLEDDSWQTTPLAVVSAFAQLVNGGHGLKPHLLRGIWRTDDLSYHPTTFTAADGIGAEASRDFEGFVQGLLPPGPDDALVVESIRSSGGKTKAQDTPAAVVKSEEAPAADALDELLRFSSVVVAAGRHGEHQLALLLMVDDAKLNLDQPSPVREAAAELISQGQSIMANRWDNEIAPPQLDSDALLYQKWSLSQSLDTPPPEIQRTVNAEMPDVTGLSLRKAMQTLQGYNLKIGIQGAGRVTHQIPAAGGSLKGVEEVKLELRMDQ